LKGTEWRQVRGFVVKSHGLEGVRQLEVEGVAVHSRRYVCACEFCVACAEKAFPPQRVPDGRRSTMRNLNLFANQGCLVVAVNPTGLDDVRLRLTLGPSCMRR
jgi:hypothetical protein